MATRLTLSSLSHFLIEPVARCDNLNIFCMNVNLFTETLIFTRVFLLQEENVAISPRAKQRLQLLGLSWRWRPVRFHEDP